MGCPVCWMNELLYVLSVFSSTNQCDFEHAILSLYKQARLWLRRLIAGGSHPLAEQILLLFQGTDEISPNEKLQFLYGHSLRIVAVIEKLAFHSGPHTFTSGIIVALATSAVHTLNNTVFFQCKMASRRLGYVHTELISC